MTRGFQVVGVVVSYELVWLGFRSFLELEKLRADGAGVCAEGT